MGRIKTKTIKRVTEKLYSEYAREFKADFRENQLLVEKFLDVQSTKLRNVMAGYVTRLAKE